MAKEERETECGPSFCTHA